MKINIGDILEEITLPNINGSNFSLSSLKGKKVLLTFYRFARCPMCNLRINEILKRYDELGKKISELTKDKYLRLKLGNQAYKNLKYYNNFENIYKNWEKIIIK